MHQLLYFTVIVLLTPLGSYARSYNNVLSVTNGGPWGTWGSQEMCPYGYYAAGFSLKVEYAIDGDDTSLNGIRLHCINMAKGKSWFHATVTSKVGSWGKWTATKWCNSGMLMNFQLRVESPQGDGDDTTANNIRFQCSGDKSEITGAGTSWGNWGGWSRWCSGRGICGIQTKVEDPQGSGDDTSLNDVRFMCCN